MNERDTLRELLYGVNSHTHVLQALEGLDPHLAGAEIGGSPHTIFQILQHMIYWQDIALARMRGVDPSSPDTAAEGWTFAKGPEDESDWEGAVASLAEGLRAIESLVADDSYDLGHPIGGRGRPERTGRGEVLMVQGHNSYHLGQIVQLRVQLDAWPPPKGGDTW
jgi:uncharacterized damage-inducible protein DinB